jgi:hypothetical protein
MLLRAIEIWFVLLTVAVLNGSVREAWITARLGGFAAHVISTVMLSAAIAFIAWISILWVGAETTTDAFVVGSTWLLLTMAFEFLAGHYLFRNPWEKLFADYNIFQGRIWVIVLFSTFLAPILTLWQRRGALPIDLSTVVILLLLASACIVAAWQLTESVRVWRRLTGNRLVTCTATGYPAAVRSDVLKAAFTALVFRSPKIRITHCSRWATGGPCDQGCIAEALAPESTVQSVVAQWYKNKKCVYCAKPIAPQSFGHRAALLDPQGTTREWSDVPADRVPDSLRTNWPVCWNCHVAETFRRKHPDLVTDRRRPKDPDRRAG